MTADRDLGDLGRLEDALDELTAVAFARLREQEATLQVNSSLGRKTDGKIHGCFSLRKRWDRRSRDWSINAIIAVDGARS